MSIYTQTVHIWEFCWRYTFTNEVDFKSTSSACLLIKCYIWLSVILNQPLIIKGYFIGFTKNWTQPLHTKSNYLNEITFVLIFIVILTFTLKNIIHITTNTHFRIRLQAFYLPLKNITLFTWTWCGLILFSPVVCFVLDIISYSTTWGIFHFLCGNITDSKKLGQNLHQ